MEGEEEMISDFIPDVRVNVPMPRCRQPKPDYSPQISTFHGYPMFSFSEPWYYQFDDKNRYDVDEIIHAEAVIEEKYNKVITFSLLENFYYLTTEIHIFEWNEAPPIYTCYVDMLSMRHRVLTYEALVWIYEELAGLHKPKEEPKPKPSLGKLRPVPTCPQCGGKINLETLKCEYCKTEFYYEEGE